MLTIHRIIFSIMYINVCTLNHLFQFALFQPIFVIKECSHNKVKLIKLS